MDQNRATNLPSVAKERKTYPIASGVLDYFPDAIAEVAHVSFLGNEQHNPGTPLHWDRSKSTDEADALARHLIQRGTLDTDGVRHSAKVAWRALALLQKEIEASRQPKVDLGYTPTIAECVELGLIDPVNTELQNAEIRDMAQGLPTEVVEHAIKNINFFLTIVLGTCFSALAIKFTWVCLTTTWAQ